MTLRQRSGECPFKSGYMEMEEFERKQEFSSEQCGFNSLASFLQFFWVEKFFVQDFLELLARLCVQGGEACC